MTGRTKRSWIINRRALKRLGVLGVALLVLGVYVYFAMIRMPGRSHRGPLPPFSAEELALADALRDDVTALAVDIGARGVFDQAALDAAAQYLDGRLAGLGFDVQRQEFQAGGTTSVNLAVEIAGTSAPNEIVVVGAHYDTCGASPGANDNGSGVAATLALAERFAARRPGRTLRFVLFTNEEPPLFQTEAMGSLRYARGCRARGEDVVAMISIETIGYYRDAPGTQSYPPLVGLAYPSRGDFIAFVGNVRSRRLVREAIGRFRETTAFPSEGAAIPGWIQGVGWSDHWAFWQAGYPGIMVTDTAPYRFPHYHLTSDLPETMDFPRMARVVTGLERVIEQLAAVE